MRGVIFGIGIGIALSGCLLGYKNLVYSPNGNGRLEEPKNSFFKKTIGTLSPQKLQEPIKNISDTFQKSISLFMDHIQKIWGKDAPIPSENIYVKYTDSYLSRAEVDFLTGVISVSTIDTNHPKESLRKAIIMTLLTPEDPRKVDLYSDKEIQYSETPYLEDLVKDNKGKIIKDFAGAAAYAEYLIAESLQTKHVVENGISRKIYWVQFNMVVDRISRSEHKYEEHVALYAKKYNLEPALIFAIIKTESNFNPYAVSPIPAYGLMQIVPTTAGRDVYKRLNNKDGIPTKEMLFTPEINIQYGSAYLNILFTHYLKGVENAISREYCVIAAYNTGAGNVLSVFHSDREKAVEIINNATSTEIYRILRTSLKYEEARNYLLKVTNAKKEFIVNQERFPKAS